ncbi:MAG: hypothetical protein LBG60_05675 [Bifidobacteriaceae bacterium]|jgi:hypothetical protein|nr:hypothetical protein [Bifidobacteriaceae bacterium]
MPRNGLRGTLVLLACLGAGALVALGIVGPAGIEAGWAEDTDELTVEIVVPTFASASSGTSSSAAASTPASASPTAHDYGQEAPDDWSPTSSASSKTAPGRSEPVGADGGGGGSKGGGKLPFTGAHVAGPAAAAAALILGGALLRRRLTRT